MGGFLETCKEHAGETYGREVAYRTYDFFVILQRYLELVPFDFRIGSVTCGNHSDLFIRYIVLTNHKIFGTDRHTILKITFIFVERVILVYVLNVGHGTRRLVERIVGILGRKRVAFDSVVTFIAFEHAEALIVVVISTIEMIVVAGRVVKRREAVGLHTLDCGGRQTAAQFFKIILIGRKKKFVGIGQTVESDVLSQSGTV